MRFLPYGRQTVEDEDIDAVVAVLRGDTLTTGPAVDEFERALAARVGAKHAVAVATGTAALHAAAFAAGVGPGDRVVVPAITFLATANCVRYLGAEPVFVDVDPDTALVDVDALERALAGGARAVIPVHMTGRPVDLPAVRARASAAGATVIEDAAHALGGAWDGDPIGSGRHSEQTIFSFHPVKHVTTGEGGAISTNDDELARRLRLFRNHGMERDAARLQQPSPGPWYYEQQVLGFNYRITDLQCALGTSQLRRLDANIARRRAIAARYDRLLRDVRHVTAAGSGDPRAASAWHLYAVLIDFTAAGRDRAAVMNGLRERGIGTQVHYIPVPAQPYYRQLGCDPAAFPGAARWYERELSLPMFPAMTDDDVDRVVAALADVLT